MPTEKTVETYYQDGEKFEKTRYENTDKGTYREQTYKIRDNLGGALGHTYVPVSKREGRISKK